METIDVICVLFPNGDRYFTPADTFDTGKAHKIMNAWKADLSPERRQQYIDANAMGGFVWMHMLKEDYDRIPATSFSARIATAVEGA